MSVVVLLYFVKHLEAKHLDVVDMVHEKRKN
jgi:hypothetical protein